MIITDDFVMINFPKTGSTFVRNVLKRVHNDYSFLEKTVYFFGKKKKPLYINFWIENIRDTSFRYGVKDEHGLCSQIPKKHISKQIVSIKRNVFERYISLYEYADWKVAPWIKVSDIKKIYPNYPDLSFKEYLNLLFHFNPWEIHPKINRKLPMGPATTQFIVFYFKNPFKVLREIDENYLMSDYYKKDMYNVHFLEQNNLNDDLYNFLSKKGYKEQKISFIKNLKRQNVSRPKNKNIKDYFNDDLISMVREKDKFLFKIFK
jgi:hypothetical protein